MEHASAQPGTDAAAPPPATQLVVAPAPGGPAERAGLRPGDELVSIGDAPVAKLSIYEAAGLLQGAEGRHGRSSARRRFARLHAD